MLAILLDFALTWRGLSQILTEGYNAYCLEDAIINSEERRHEPAAVLCGREETLYNDRDDDYDHTDQRKCAGFGELLEG